MKKLRSFDMGKDESKVSKLGLYRDSFFHITNNGTYKYLLPEFNEIIYEGCVDDESSSFIKRIREATKLVSGDQIEYLKGSIEKLRNYQIGSGIEAFTINNTPFSVIKVLKTSPKLIRDRNVVPASVPYLLRAIVEDNEEIYYVYTLTKVNIIPERDLAYAFKRLDIVMMKYGYFSVIGYSDDKVRVYTDGFIVIDDIGLNNIGYGMDDKVHIIDCLVFDIDEWEEANDYKIPNKIACISYNSNDLLKKKLEEDLKTSEFNMILEIRKRLDILDDILTNNNIEIRYEHI